MNTDTEALRAERKAFIEHFGAEPESMHPVAWEAWQAARASAQEQEGKE